MSASEPTSVTRGQGHLVVKAPPGVEITIVDGSLSTIEQGTISLKRELPVGVYTVRWSAAGKTEQHVFRLKASSAPLKLSYDDRIKAHPAPIIGAARDAFEARQFEAFRDLLMQRQDESEAEIILLVRSDDERTHADPGRSLRLSTSSTLRNLRGGASTIEPRRRCNLEEGWSALRFSVAPGTYFLRYQSTDRTALEQAVYAFSGRSTIGFFRYGREAVREKSGDSASFKSRRGIDPSGTIFISGKQGALRDLDKEYQLSEILLHALSRRAGRLLPGVVPALREAGTDPLQQIYGVGVLLTRPPLASADGFKPVEGPVPEPAVPPQNVEDAAAILGALELAAGAAPWADLVCARWRLALSGLQMADTVAGLPATPMLEATWRWASAWSVEHPQALQKLETDSIAIGQMQVRGNPWLAWRLAGAASAQPVESESKERLQANTAMLATKLQVLVDSALQSTETRSYKEVLLPTLDLSQLSTATRNLARTMMQLGGSEAWSRPDATLLRRLASSTGAPAGWLSARVEKALTEISGPGSEEVETPTDLFSLDPLKGQFGGQAEVDGVRLSLESFAPSNHKEFLALTIAVEAAGPESKLGSSVTFHLHPTFNPSSETVRVFQGRATFVCYAMGGFTLGALTAAGTRLELDLALEARLPSWFRER